MVLGVDRSYSEDKSVSSGLTSLEELAVSPVRFDSFDIGSDLALVEEKVFGDSLSKFLLVSKDLGPGFDGTDISREILAGSEFSGYSSGESL